MRSESLRIGCIPAILWGESSDRVYLYIHGKMGCKEEAKSFAEVVCKNGCQVLSFDLPGHGERADEIDHFVPWEIIPELASIWTYASKIWEMIALRATSIGAWFSMLAWNGQPLYKALFVSPVLDMERLIRNMMNWEGITSEQLEKEQEIATDFGETLSWKYLQYVIMNPVQNWNCHTEILYADGDQLIEKEIVYRFCRKFRCGLTVMEGGEHWFHTPEQLAFLQNWEQNNE